MSDDPFVDCGAENSSLSGLQLDNNLFQYTSGKTFHEFCEACENYVHWGVKDA